MRKRSCGRAASARSRWADAGVIAAVVLLGACSAGAGDDATRSTGIAVGEPTTTAATSTVDTRPSAVVSADDLPVAFTPAGGWTVMPPPVLATCTEPLVDGAVDMRGMWEVVSVQVDEADAPDHEAIGERQRIEQCGDRVVITAGGIVHDMRADGTEEGGVHDVSAADKTTPITVVAAFEDGVHVLRPVGAPVEIRRRIEGDQLIWEYVSFIARLERVDAP